MASFNCRSINAIAKAATSHTKKNPDDAGIPERNMVLGKSIAPRDLSL
jgi:hypothetical protein